MDIQLSRGRSAHLDGASNIDVSALLSKVIDLRS
jgi:hypothetical protein